MNRAILIGRLTANPRVTGDQTKVVRYTLAVDRPTRDGERKADFISCVCFGKTADFAENYLKQGTKIAVEGTIQTGSYEKNGQTIYTTDVIVNSHEFCESKKDEPKAEPKTDSRGFAPVDDTGLPF